MEKNIPWYRRQMKLLDENNSTSSELTRVKSAFWKQIRDENDIDLLVSEKENTPSVHTENITVPQDVSKSVHTALQLGHKTNLVKMKYPAYEVHENILHTDEIVIPQDVRTSVHKAALKSGRKTSPVKMKYPEIEVHKSILEPLTNISVHRSALQSSPVKIKHPNSPAAQDSSDGSFGKTSAFSTIQFLNLSMEDKEKVEQKSQGSSSWVVMGQGHHALLPGQSFSTTPFSGRCDSAKTSTPKMASDNPKHSPFQTFWNNVDVNTPSPNVLSSIAKTSYDTETSFPAIEDIREQTMHFTQLKPGTARPFPPNPPPVHGSSVSDCPQSYQPTTPSVDFDLARSYSLERLKLQNLHSCSASDAKTYTSPLECFKQRTSDSIAKTSYNTETCFPATEDIRGQTAPFTQLKPGTPRPFPTTPPPVHVSLDDDPQSYWATTPSVDSGLASSYSWDRLKLQNLSSCSGSDAKIYASPLEPFTPRISDRYSMQDHQSMLETFHTRPKTDIVALMKELAVTYGNQNCEETHNSGSNKEEPVLRQSTDYCVFCKKNNQHATFYRSHTLRDRRGLCQCPVLRVYVCPLCGGTGDYAHTLKYCPYNSVTQGDPVAAGLPPGKVTNWRMMAEELHSRK